MSKPSLIFSPSKSYTESVKKFFSLLFVPQYKNNHRALLLRPAFIAILILLYLANQSLIGLLAGAHPGVLGYASNITPEKIIEFTNSERGKYGLPPLSLSQNLNQAALLKAGDMFAFNYWAHESPSGRTPWDFFREANYSYSVAGENLARDFPVSDQVVTAWMKSPSHKDNIVNPKYQEIGVAVVDGTINGIATTLVVQMLGTPTSSQIASLPEKAAQIFSEPVQAINEEPLLQVRKENISSSPAPNSSPVEIQGQGIIAPLVEPSYNPLLLTKLIGAFLFGLIVAVLILDSYLIFKKKIYRISGSFPSQIAFLAVLFLLMILGQQGAIF